MPSTTNILVPLDGSALAEEAVLVAVEIAKPAGGTVTLFVAADPAAATALHAFADSGDITRAMAADAYLDQVAARLREDGVTVAKTSSDGTNAAVDIIERAAAADISMIVLTSHGQSGIGRWLLGSVADKVARSATVPVVIVPSAGRGS
jgi:nucleotide-binding universal stress UspA family protein